MTINTQREERDREIKGIPLERERHSCQVSETEKKDKTELEEHQIKQERELIRRQEVLESNL